MLVRLRTYSKHEINSKIPNLLGAFCTHLLNYKKNKKTCTSVDTINVNILLTIYTSKTQELQSPNYYLYLTF